jgi:MinD-like ATPase involved in chromosome partitioning or flagellar assembly
VRTAGDAGIPIVVAEPHSAVTAAFQALAERVAAALDATPASAPIGVAPA